MSKCCWTDFDVYCGQCAVIWFDVQRGHDIELPGVFLAFPWVGFHRVWMLFWRRFPTAWFFEHLQRKQSGDEKLAELSPSRQFLEWFQVMFPCLYRLKLKPLDDDKNEEIIPCVHRSLQSFQNPIYLHDVRIQLFHFSSRFHYHPFKSYQRVHSCID